MTPSYIHRVVGKGAAILWSSADHSSKQNNEKKGPLSLPPSLLLQGDMSMGEPHSLLAVYASAEKQICDHKLVLRKKRPKKKSQHVVNF